MKILTKDMFEASYLLAMGMSLKEVLAEKRTILFKFEGAETLRVLKSKFEDGRADVNIRKFRNSLNVIRDRMYEKRKNLINA